ncbi:MAG: hypothetical protein ABJC79_09680 [Acidimicrobiia bacterium]
MERKDLESDPDAPDTVDQFHFSFDARFRHLLAALDVRPANSRVTIGVSTLMIQFGPWRVDTPITNVREVCETGPYRWYRAIGPRLSLADRGLTFGSSTAGGVCVLLHEPVPGIVPFATIRHPGITLTVDDPPRFATVLRQRARLSPSG